MNPSVRTAGLPQYPDLEARIADVATATAAGDMVEDEAREAILVAVYATDLVAATVRYWLAGKAWPHLHDDLVFAAESWLIRAVTGNVVGEHMVDTGEPGATLLDLARVRGGASAVGYLRKGLLMEMRKFLRTLERRSTLGSAHHHLIDTTMLTGDLDVDAATVDRQVIGRLRSLAVRGNAGSSDLRAELVHSQYLDRSRGQSASARTVARGEALRAYYQVPSACRPLEAPTRRAMLEAATADVAAAYRSMKALLRSAPTDEVAEALLPLWADYDEADLESILCSPRSVLAAHTLAVVALSPHPRPPRSARRKFRVHLSRLFRLAGLDPRDGAELAAAFLAEEFEGPAEVTAGWSWTELTASLTADHPEVLGATLKEARRTLTAMLQELDAHST